MSRRVCGTALAALLAVAPAPVRSQQVAPPEAAAWWRHVQVLADDSLKGRDTGSPGHESAARYVIAQFKAAGLRPGGTDGWLQPVPFLETTLDVATAAYALREGDQWTPLALFRDLRVVARPATGDVEAPLVFAGYGLSLPQAGVDELRGLDVRGKIVMHLNALPAGLSAPLQAHASRSRWPALQQAGAVGILAISGAAPWPATTSGPAPSSITLADTTLDDAWGQKLGGQLNPALAARLFAGSAITWDSVVALARRGAPLPTGPLAVSLRATQATTTRAFTSPNVVGVLPGRDKALRGESVVLTAHLDHVGTLKGPGITGDSIFNGAMDNASGVATLIETARLAARRGGNLRTLAFAAVTAEEKGLLGSRYLAAHPTPAMPTVVANLNTDMYLPLIPLTGVFAYGYDESDLADDLDAAVAARGLRVYPDPQPQENRFVRSDQYSFIRRGIPALAFKVGYIPGTAEDTTWNAWVRDHYHRVTDDVTRPMNFATAAGFNALYAELALRVANRPTRPAWRKTSFFAVQ